MEKFTLKEGETFIELNNLMKILSWVNSGGEAKIRIDQSEVLVNNEIEIRRRRKLKSGDIIQFGEEKAVIE
ncbi:MAG: ribosome-associated protein [Cyclobacteriaceae bacterium]|jgi:ribosome-associated protein